MKNFTQLVLLCILLFCLNIANASSQEAQSNNSKTLQNQLKQEFPADLPKYVNTGNEKEDIERYNQAKTEWIEKNPELYEEMSKKNINKEEKGKKLEDVEKTYTIKNN